MRELKIGVFIAYLNDSYQRYLWRYIVERAREVHCTVIGFCGHGLGIPSLSHATMNQVYYLANPQSIDGIVVFSNTVGTYHGPQAIINLLENQVLPKVSLGFMLPEIPSISAHGDEAMEALVTHLIKEHGRSRFAIVTGPKDHLESMERETALRQVLAEHQLELRPELRYEGNFFGESGGLAAKAFLQTGLDFDAVVCFNDHMAMGVMAALRDAGKSVPTEISVTGFDDIEEAAWVSPPLTTIRQPLRNLARSAFDMVLAQIKGEPVASQGLHCQFVPRQSCGCPPDLPLALCQEKPESRVIESEELAQLEQAIESGDQVGILTVLSAALLKHWGDRAAISYWRTKILALQREYASNGQLPSWSDQAIAWLGEEELRWEQALRIDQQRHAELIRVFSVRLLGLLQLEAIVRHGEDHFQELGIPRGYLVLFSEPGSIRTNIAPESSRWITTILNSDRSMSCLQFKTNLLAPPEPGFSWGGKSWLVEPLVYQNEFLGYLLIECANEDQLAFEALRESFSTAVKGAQLIEEVQDHRLRLEKQVRLRTRELKIANKDLQDVSNRTMQAIGQDIHDDLCQHLVGISMLSSVLEESMATQNSSTLPAIREIRELVDQAVMRSRQFARSLYPAGLAEHGLASALEDLIGTMRRTVPGVTVNLVVEGETITIDPELAYQFYRIIQESLSNALRHSASEIILVRVVRRSDSLLVEVRDFGKGLASKEIGAGMGTRIMRNRAETIGANLEIFNLDPGVCVSCSLSLAGGQGE